MMLSCMFLDASLLFPMNMPNAPPWVHDNLLSFSLVLNQETHPPVCTQYTHDANILLVLVEIESHYDGVLRFSDKIDS